MKEPAKESTDSMDSMTIDPGREKKTSKFNWLGKSLSTFYISVYLYICASIFIDIYMFVFYELAHSLLIPLYPTTTNNAITYSKNKDINILSVSSMETMSFVP